MSSGRPIEIIGGGLAGLSLGLALCRRHVPVTLHEAGSYPRHRVCGEFITGLDPTTIEALGLGPALSDALHHRELAWFVDDRPTRTQTLPSSALGISRHRLDARLADAFVGAGGNLLTGRRITEDAASPGRVVATGRRPGSSRWLGLKVHVMGLALRRDLELHLGDDCYVGLSRIEDGRVNVCGLFRRRHFTQNPAAGITANNVTARGGDAESVETPPGAGHRPGPPRHAVLLQYLAAAGLAPLLQRLTAAAIDAESFCAVAALHYDRRIREPDRIQIGDAGAIIPPFTGDGMAMAFQSAALVLGPLCDYARGAATWEDTCRTANAALRERFATRLRWAGALHPFLLRRPGQRWLARLSSAHLLPLRPLYSVLH